MKSWCYVAFAALPLFSMTAHAADGRGNLYTNVGATLVSNGDAEETAYFVQAGYNYRLTKMLSADLSYKKVETLNSSVAANSDDFVKTYDSYGVGLRVDQALGLLAVYGKAGASYITSETTEWDAGAGAEKTETDETFKPYAGAGVSLSTPLGFRFDAGVKYQLLADDEHATSFNAGVNFAF